MAGIDKKITEFIIVDNGSTDNSKDFVVAYLEEEKVIYYYETQEYNLGIGAGRNRGIQLAKGEFIYIIDDDAIINPNCHNFFTDAINFFRDHDIVGGLTTNVYDECLNDWRRSRKSKLYTDKTPWIYMLHGNSHFIRKGIQNAQYCPTIKYGYEDLYMSLRILDAGLRNALIERISTIHKPATNKWAEGSEELNIIKMKGIAGLMTVKCLLYPNKYRFLIYLAAIARYLKYFKLNFKYINETIRLFRLQTKNVKVDKIKDCTIRSLIHEYGIWATF